MNAGHRPGAAVLRVIGDGGNMRAHEFKAYCPVALAGLGYLPTTIASRSITIPMRRRAPDEHVHPFRDRVPRPEGEALRRRLAAWVSRHTDDIPEAPPRLPAGVTDRPADCWEPLIAVGGAAGGSWPDLARNGCVAIVKDTSAADDQSLGVRLLSDIRAASGTDDRLATATLLERLAAVDDAPWYEQLDGRSDKARGSWLARKLRPYGTSPRAVRIGADHLRGYDAQDFADAWRRYLRDPARALRPAAVPIASRHWQAHPTGKVPWNVWPCASVHTSLTM